MGKKNQKGPNLKKSSTDKKDKNWLHKYSRFVNLFIIVAGVSYAYVLIHEKWSEITALSMVSRIWTLLAYIMLTFNCWYACI